MEKVKCKIDIEENEECKLCCRYCKERCVKVCIYAKRNLYEYLDEDCKNEIK